MIEKLTKWAEAGDDAAQFNLSKILRESGEDEQADYWLKKSADNKNIFAMKELAEKYLQAKNFDAAATLYKDLVELYGDENAMENLLNLRADDSETLKFILDKINSMYNEIYFRNRDFLRRVFNLGTRRHNELTMQTVAAVERRRIASRIRKMQ